MTAQSVRYSLNDHLNEQVLIGGQPIHLTRQQNDLLFLLYVNRGRIVLWETIIGMLWGEDPEGGPLGTHQAVNALSGAIRRKTGLPIHGLYGYGVILEGEICP